MSLGSCLAMVAGTVALVRRAVHGTVRTSVSAGMWPVATTASRQYKHRDHGQQATHWDVLPNPRPDSLMGRIPCSLTPIPSAQAKSSLWGSASESSILR